MPDEKSQNLLQKIAQLLQEEDGNNEPNYLSIELAKINSRLDKIESQIIPQKSDGFISHPKKLHPSQEKIQLIEEIADEVFSQGKWEKACLLETNKPCDNCSMCNSRGF